MTDQNKEVVQETPQETPPAPASSDEQVTTTETPTEVTSGAPPVETVQKTAEQVKADRAHFQTELASTQKELRAMRTKEATKPTPQTQPQQGQMTQVQMDDMNDRLRDNPLEAMQAIAQDNRISMQNEFANMKQELRRDVELKDASDRANRTANEFCVRHNIDPKHLDTAMKTIKELDVKGDPATIASLALEMAQVNNFKSNSATINMQTAAETSASIKQQALTEQPEAGATSSPKSISFQEGIAGKFSKPQNKNTLSRLMDNLGS